MDSLRFNRHVPDDLAQAIAWYDAKSNALGNRFRVAVDEVFDAIDKTPELWSFAFRDLNVWFHRTRRFPYLILYRVEESVILVIGIFHGASDPEKWLRRATTT